MIAVGKRTLEVREKITNLLNGQNPFSYKNLHFYNKNDKYLSFIFDSKVHGFLALLGSGD
jgi:hypothetical protein